MSRARRRNTDIILIIHRVIVKGSLRRYVYKPFSNLPLGEVMYVARLETFQECSISTRTLLTQESFLITPPDQKPLPENSIHRNSYDCGLLSV